jgi:hypothetical protein
MKGVGRIYQQTFIDTYAKVAFAKLYDRKTPITAADELRGKVGDGVNQAADFISAASSIPSLNFTPSMTFGNWF